MYLKSLTLKGFKSFASATTLRLEPGITCVVGPNGSGKSNILDALRWVMGEQGAKGLRGGKMEDVIFAGTSGRAPLGRAEVTLTIDNSDGALPIDYSEVSITRRMFRDGAGEYEINGTKCRLMDVQELLSDSGIGREMHVIVGQGQLAAILESKPEERRAFIEEAAGVLKHRRRKEKAVRKLDSMQANLARLTDLTTELRRQLKPLGRQAEVARRAQTIQADLRDARLRLAADDLVRRRAELADQSGNEAAVRLEQNEVAEQLDEANALVAEHSEAVAALDPAVKAAGEGWFSLSALAERVSSTERIASERARLLSEPVQHAPGRDPDELEAEAERVAEEEAELIEALEEAAMILEEATEELASREESARDAEKAHMAAVAAIADRREGLARLAGQVETLRTRAESVEAESGRLTAAIAEAVERAEAAEAEFEQVQGQIAELDASEASLDEHHERSVAAYNAASARVEELRASEREAEQKVASLVARIEALSMNLDRGDGAAWIAEHVDGVTAAVSSRLSIRAGYEKAVAVALGPVAEAVAAGSRNLAVSAIDKLRDADGGRASVVVEGVAPGTVPTGPLPDGAVWAASCVTAPSSLEGAVTAALAGYVLVGSVADAVAVVAERPELRAVTSDGDVISHGVLTGGSAARQSTLEVQKSIDAAEATLGETRRSVESISAALAGAAEELASRREVTESALAALHESDAQLGAIYEQLARLGQAARSARDEAERLVAQRTRIEGSRDETRAALVEHEERLRLAEELPEDSVSVGTDERDAAAAALAAARSVEMEARLARRTAEERAAGVRGKAEGLRRAAAAERAARERAEAAAAARLSAAAVASSVAEGAALVSSRLGRAVTRAAAHRDALEASRAQRAGALDVARQESVALTARLAQLTDAVHRDEVARAQAALRIEQLEEQVVASFAMSPDDLVAEYGPDVPLPPSALELEEYEAARERGETVVKPQGLPFDRAVQERRLKLAEKDLATLGRVNPLALEEFAALEERYNFLSTQLEDVKSAREDLLSVVEEVDAKILQVFTEAWVDVEREFVEVFKTLFPGGEGKLILTEPGDMLTTGIDVEARPPGKKVKRLSLLSGGEKSLTAVAMLVAIFRARPSPFYVMDEVEAALDDTNLRRLISLFEQLRDKSQLIVITHQKPTMEVADALYGVSMRGDGITQVISQRIRGQELGALPV
ncbi:Chromosome partition protein Smc (plasmid) [Tsukamurella tyrosinosolvens]|uniref:Chromosome partition protein Smc n=1 Tax=Tsukamurella tyrosinosolvens TaxID=57704 RepID=A0A1H4R614_TSUTY|nr:chromosome segregation protein SMC [Tsukamurella tyrosinosolvens]KXO91400.1 chromosome segregation protein SMC [Tsukamurella tyrosinosolvens]SEC27335.1 condensin subunit Smc [Tsukamurella tyrosinosolvens]VEH92238.1 Chromosome partition protein Smc [Tsukamurella tyrosinosolvens]